MSIKRRIPLVSEILKTKLKLAWEGISFENFENRPTMTSNRLTSCNGYFLQLCGNGNYVNVKTQPRQNSSYLLKKDNKIFCTKQRNDNHLGQLIDIQQNSCAQIISKQFNDVFATSVFGCELSSTNNQCKFCNASTYEGYKYTTKQFSEALTIASNESSPPKSIIINSGSFVDPNKTSFDHLESYVRVAKEHGLERVHVELMPTVNYSEKEIVGLAKKMVNSGVSSVQMNIEIWDEDFRKNLMPYKGKIERKTYLEWFSILTKIFPKNKIYSVIIANLNSANGLQKATEALVEVGVIPSIEILRRITNFSKQFGEYPMSIDELWNVLCETYTLAVNELNLNISELEGCAECGGCNFVSDFVEFAKD